MKLIIAGGRNFNLTGHDFIELDFIHEANPITEIVSGACPTGVDRDGERWAKKNKIPIKKFPANWSLGKKAGPLRNREMAKYADAVILFPGGRGTASMRNEALKAKIQIYEGRPCYD